MKNTMIKESGRLNDLYNELYYSEFLNDEGIDLGKYFPNHYFRVEDEAPDGIVEVVCQMLTISNKEKKPIYAIYFDNADSAEYVIADLKDIENILRELLLKAKLYEEKAEEERAKYDLKYALDELKNNKVRVIELEHRINELKSKNKVKRNNV